MHHNFNLRSKIKELNYETTDLKCVNLDGVVSKLRSEDDLQKVVQIGVDDLNVLEETYRDKRWTLVRKLNGLQTTFDVLTRLQDTIMGKTNSTKKALLTISL